MNAHIFIIVGIGHIVNSLISFFVGVDHLVYYTSLAWFVSEDSLYGPLLRGIEIFHLWKLAQIMIGLQILTALSKKAAFLITLVIALAQIILGYIMMFVLS